MTNAQVKRAILDAGVRAYFCTKDGLGTSIGRGLLEARFPAADLEKFNAAVAALGLRAWWPVCSENYGKVRCIGVGPQWAKP